MPTCTRTLLSLLVTSVLACDDAAERPADERPADELPADAEAVDEPVVTDLRDGELRVEAPVVADLELPRGPRLVFIDLGDPEAAPEIGVYEYVPAGHLGTADFPELAGAGALELFLAATAADVPVPPRLRAAADARTTPRARGWLIPAVAQGVAPRGICTNSDFMDAVESFGYADLGTPVYRLDKQPDSSVFFEPQGYTFLPQNAYWEAYRYTVGGNAGSQWSNIDAYYTRVAVCALGAHPNACGSGGCVSHPGPTVNFSYRDDDDQPFGYQTVLNHDFPGTGVVHWHWQSGSNFDWRTRIDHAAADDSFDIGHAVHVD
jgi:hypothetical protein